MNASPQGTRGFEHDTLVRFGRWLASLRNDRSQMEVMQATGIHFSQVSRLELGRIENPGFRDLVLLGGYYGVTPNEIAQRLGIYRGEVTPTNGTWREVFAIAVRLSPAVSQKLAEATLALFQAAEVR